MKAACFFASSTCVPQTRVSRGYPLKCLYGLFTPRRRRGIRRTDAGPRSAGHRTGGWIRCADPHQPGKLAQHLRLFLDGWKKPHLRVHCGKRKTGRTDQRISARRARLSLELSGGNGDFPIRRLAKRGQNGRAGEDNRSGETCDHQQFELRCRMRLLPRRQMDLLHLQPQRRPRALRHARRGEIPPGRKQRPDRGPGPRAQVVSRLRRSPSGPGAYLRPDRVQRGGVAGLPAGG